MENLKNVLSNKLNLLILLVAIIFCFQVFSLFSNGNETQKINYIKDEISDLKTGVKVIYDSYERMDKKIETFNTKINNIDNQVKINNTKIDNLKKDEKTKIDNFKSYDARMYERYFTERYAKKPITATIK
jgi:peptidoglycan hydrolase CwlO-like protein